MQGHEISQQLRETGSERRRGVSGSVYYTMKCIRIWPSDDKLSYRKFLEFVEEGFPYQTVAFECEPMPTDQRDQSLWETNLFPEPDNKKDLN